MDIFIILSIPSLFLKDTATWLKLGMKPGPSYVVCFLVSTGKPLRESKHGQYIVKKVTFTFNISVWVPSPLVQSSMTE